ncbi:uncharacterized protein LOC113281400 isoform X1 [Papaver somniferum]|uniref:uncharacterized protein LOC113281400 isoform X1 n=1 Tax=Papaver somniferum TaxID=3469 RepID=UPI000E6F6458|nr:uncharacterized protein LOC113281400 isoform X1 [Papaver somniferum]XP_026385918.1 uncharacterized protein LOC113281400 isoform X1 [Papaver somniferum]
MMGGETLDVLSEIEALVSDKLQVVSYKWLSRNFSVSSNDAKRLLQELAEKHGNEMEVIYTLSGWLKKNPTVYRIRLVSAPKLSDIKDEFEDNYSAQVYSVQACIPKDPAAIWSAEFIQSEELFDQPNSAENCLRDNRFCGVLNSYVKRNLNESSIGVAPPQPKRAPVTVPARSNTSNQTISSSKLQLVKQETLKTGQSSTVVASAEEVKNTGSSVNILAGKTDSGREKEVVPPANKTKSQSDKTSSGSGGSLTNLWGRAKSKPCSPPSTDEAVPCPVVTSEARVRPREAVEAISSDDDDDQIVNRRRSSNGERSRKRRVVLDYSDEEDCEGAVNLASPDPPRKQLDSNFKKTANLALEKNHLDFDEQKEDLNEIKQEKAAERDSRVPPKHDSNITKSSSTGISFPNKTESCFDLDGVNKKNAAMKATPNSPKRKKVLKTRIDERGREVSEVVWEGEDKNTKSNDKSTTTVSPENRPLAAKKSPALGSIAQSNPVSKAGAKKTGKGAVKDAKQGNILSFFKKA